MEQSERYPSYVVSVARALSTSMQPLSIDALMEKVRGQRPVSSSMRTAVYRALKQLYQAVPVGEEQYGWLTHLLQNNFFRHPLSAEEVRRGFLLLDELEHAVFFPQFFQTHRPDSRNLKIELMGGPVVECEAAVERRTWSLRLGAPFIEWIDEQGGAGHDDLIIMVVDAQAGHYLLRLQPREARDEERIQERNLAIVAAAEEVVTDRYWDEQPAPTWELAALLIGRSLFLDTTPPDDLHLILQRYSMLGLVDGNGYVLKDSPAAKSIGSAGSGSVDSSRRPERTYSMKSMRDEPAGPPVVGMNGSEGEMDYGPEDFDDSGSCQDYEEYLEQLTESGRPVTPLSHSDYHLLEAELEMLISLEQEFGYLMPDQQTRVDELADRLFIDPDVLRSSEQDAADDDFDGPQFWQN
jgi:hypothetical protein